MIAVVMLVQSVLLWGANVRVGAERMEQYLSEIKGKRVALVVNQTSVVHNREGGRVHLLDTLLRQGFDVRKVFAPEHGLRGEEDAGATVQSGVDSRTGVRVVSIYGRNKKPSAEQLSDVDVVVFDIQDVGCRFYTYISTLHYVMEACGENGKKLLVLDRPNPNDYVDGPVLRDSSLRSFVGMDFIPLLHGCTVGELSQMFNLEGWLSNGVVCDVEVVTAEGWHHGEPWHLEIKPSPNLPNDDAIRLYPSLCLFEGTCVSVGRGTEMPFQVLGHPQTEFDGFSFVPSPLKGMDSNPMWNGEMCKGIDLRQDRDTHGFSLKYLQMFHGKLGSSMFKYPSFFDKLAGTRTLRKQLGEGKTEDEIRRTWECDLQAYRRIRSRYLLYGEQDSVLLWHTENDHEVEKRRYE